jgi:hypothetical protein
MCRWSCDRIHLELGFLLYLRFFTSFQIHCSLVFRIAQSYVIGDNSAIKIQITTTATTASTASSNLCLDSDQVLCGRSAKGGTFFVCAPKSSFFA